MTSEQGLLQFIALYEVKYSVKLERQEALSMFLTLVEVVKIGNSPGINIAGYKKSN